MNIDDQIILMEERAKVAPLSGGTFASVRLQEVLLLQKLATLTDDQEERIYELSVVWRDALRRHNAQEKKFCEYDLDTGLPKRGQAKVNKPDVMNKVIDILVRELDLKKNPNDNAPAALACLSTAQSYIFALFTNNDEAQVKAAIIKSSDMISKEAVEIRDVAIKNGLLVKVE